MLPCFTHWKKKKIAVPDNTLYDTPEWTPKHLANAFALYFSLCSCSVYFIKFTTKTFQYGNDGFKPLKTILNHQLVIRKVKKRGFKKRQ